ncbi:MAG: YchF-related putative GTPase [Candidatus Anstonellales archaeon]
MGLVGKPSSGKSTFFSAATMASVPISPVPFTTIEPNIGTAYVRVEDIGKEFGVVSNPREGYIAGGIRFVPFELMDVAGLIPGASEGKGLGNQFLNDLGRADLLIHIVDISGSTNELGEYIGSGHDPQEDIIFLEDEINKWYGNVIERNLDKMIRSVKAGKKEEEAVAEALSSFRIDKYLAKETVERFGGLNSWKERVNEVGTFLRQRTKPIIIAANKIDLEEGGNNFEKIKGRYFAVPCSAEAELVLRKASKAGLIHYIPGENKFEVVGALNPQQEKALEYVNERVLKRFGSTGVQDTLDKAVFEFLKYIAVFPAGSKLEDSKGRILPDCFLMPPGSTLVDFANKIHSDFAKNLLFGVDARTKQRLAKDYKLRHRDAIEIVSAA